MTQAKDKDITDKITKLLEINLEQWMKGSLLLYTLKLHKADDHDIPDIEAKVERALKQLVQIIRTGTII